MIVAGPGTGKTYTFRLALERTPSRGLALTFIRNLVRDLEAALSDIADVFTFHGYCKWLGHRLTPDGLAEGWHYYPALPRLLAEDGVAVHGQTLEDEDVAQALHNLDHEGGILKRALELAAYYNAAGHTDVVYRMLRRLEADPAAVPDLPLVVVDEYQDFSLLETRLIGVLGTNSPVVVAGDDDQALYAFKHASANYIRDLANADREDVEVFNLPYCSRCTQVIVDAVNQVVATAQREGLLQGRLDKPYACYLPDKRTDSDAHPTIVHARCSVERNNAPYMGRYVLDQVGRIPAEDIAESHDQAYPTVLVCGPSHYVQRVYDGLAAEYPWAEYRTSDSVVVEPLDGYRLLAADPRSRLGWRILLAASWSNKFRDLVATAIRQDLDLVDYLPGDFVDQHLEITGLVVRLQQGDSLTADQEQAVERAVQMAMPLVQTKLGLGNDEDLDERPECPKGAPSIVCTSLIAAKGLSAGHVYVVGMNNDDFPRSPSVISDQEVCQFLVALSRTRKLCHLVSCRRIGNQPRRPSVFIDWIKNLTTHVQVDKHYFQ